MPQPAGPRQKTRSWRRINRRSLAVLDRGAIERAGHIVVRQFAAAGNDGLERLDNFLPATNPFFLSLDREYVVAQHGRDANGVANPSQIDVLRTEQRADYVRIGEWNNGGRHAGVSGG